LGQARESAADLARILWAGPAEDDRTLWLLLFARVLVF